MPWADLFLFAVIAGVLGVWWLRAPEAPSAPNVSTQSVLSAQRSAASPTVALMAALQLDDPTPTPMPTPLPPPTLAPTDIPAPPPTMQPGPTRHKVQAGESVAVIAGLYGSTMGAIISANSLPADGRIGVGQELLIPVAGPSGGPGPTATPGSTGLMYTVSQGDTISGIAERYKSRVDWIMKANSMQPGETLHIGRALLIPLVPETPTPTPTAVITPMSPTPTAIPGLIAPNVLTPANGAIVTGEESVLLTWTSVGLLAPDEWYVVTLMTPEKETPVATWWTKSTTWRLPTEYRPEGNAGLDYAWRVQVRRGSSEAPGEATSPTSATQRFTWR